MVMDSATMLGGIVNNHSPVDLTTLTPIAGLSRGPSAIVVPKKNRRMPTCGTLLAALKQNPRGIKWTGGSLGGPGHLTVAGLAKGAGVTVKDVNYVPTAGGW